MAIGDVIRRARVKKGLSVVEAAALCNVTRGRFYQWEDSDRILRKNIPPLAKALDLSEKYLKRINGRRKTGPSEANLNGSHPAKNGSLGKGVP